MILSAALLCPLVEIALGEEAPFEALNEEEMRQIYQQARLTPSAQQIGLSCAFFANVPVLTIAGRINIADRSGEALGFISSIYALRRGDDTLMSAFDRGMFFALFGISAKPHKIYHREATRGELLADAEILVRRELAGALDKGQFVSLRVVGEFGGAHNVLLLARRGETFYIHNPLWGKTAGIPVEELASLILCVSKARSTETKRYFTSFHTVSIPAPKEVRKPLVLRDLAVDLEIALSEGQKELIAEKLVASPEGDGVHDRFPHLRFATTSTGQSLIHKDLAVGSLEGVYNLTKLAVNSYSIGAREVLPVLMMKDGPLVAIGYTQRDKPGWIFTDGRNKVEMGFLETLTEFKESGSLFGYIEVPRS